MRGLFKPILLSLATLLLGGFVGACIINGPVATVHTIRDFASQIPLGIFQAKGATEPTVTIETPSILPERITLGSISDEYYTPPTEGKAIRVNLETMELVTYENGSHVTTYTVLAKGKPGSYYETPGGEYKVLLKEEKHLSSVGKIWMPYSIQFFGNYFIHGWPYYQNGNELPVGSGYSGGCIRLATTDAQALYEWVDKGTAVSVFSTASLSEDNIETRGYFLLNPKKKISGVTASNYLVGDLETGDIIMEKNSEELVPIASVTKMMTALTALEVVSQRKTTTITSADVATLGNNGELKVGEVIPTNDLIYPLLMESSNDAGTALANFYGYNGFISMMNEKARAVGMDASSFADPTGLSEKNISTPRDLFRMLAFIFNNKSFILDVTLEQKHTAGSHTWYNTSQFLRTDGFLGGKRGYTDPAREKNEGIVELKLSEFDTRKIAVVVLGSEDRYRDTLALIRYLQSNIYYAGSLDEVVFYTPPPPPPPPTDTHLVFGGDVMLDRGVRSSVEKNYGGDYSKLFEPLTLLAEADMSFINLEGDVSDVGRNVGSKYSFRMDPVVIPVMKAAGIDIVSFANNHVGDWSKEAFDDTRARLTENEIEYTGAGDTKSEAEKPVIFEHNGNTIGYLGFTDVGPDWLAATEKSSGILLASDPRFTDIIEEASKEAPFLVVSVHWGDEYKPANDRQKALAHKAIDAGADLIIGHHPHVIEESEWYNGKYIIYSLGNLIFDQYFSDETMQGLLLEVVVDKGEIATVKKNLVRLDGTYRPKSIEDYDN